MKLVVFSNYTLSKCIMKEISVSLIRSDFNTLRMNKTFSHRLVEQGKKKNKTE